MASKDIMMRLRAQDKSKNAFNSVNKSLNNTQQSMGKIKGALAAAFSVGIITNFMRQTLELADTIGKTADSIGVSTTFLQKYQFAAEQSGLTQEEFNKGMMNFTKMVGQASIRTTEAGRTLEKLGIKLKDVDGNTRKTEDVFVDLFEALDGVGSEFKKNAILADLFGRAGVKLSVMGKDGSDAMKALAESATGVIPEETIRNAEVFNDTMNQLKREVLLPLRNAAVTVSIAFLELLDILGMVERKQTIPELENDVKNLQAAIKEMEETGGITIEGGIFSKSTPEDLVRTKERLATIQQQITDAEEIEKRKSALLNGSQIDFDPAVLNPLKESVTIVEQFANTVEGKLTSAFQTFFDFTKKEFLDFKTLAMGIAQAVINELIKVFIIESLVASIKSSITSFAGGIEYDMLTAGLDFDGGGYTGSGVRAGGIDGKGGFMAMLHPNETVIDHTKGQGMGGGAVVNFNISTVDATGFDELLASRKAMITAMINNAMNARGKMGVV